MGVVSDVLLRKELTGPALRAVLLGLALFSLILLIGCLQQPAHEQEKEQVHGPGGREVVTAYLGDEELRLEVAATPEKRIKGLMYREGLGEKNGMLFIFEDNGYPAIWMKNVRFPLDILWLDDEMRIVYIYRNAPSCSGEPCPVYLTPVNARYVLELPANFTLKHGIGVGDKLNLETAYRAP